MRIITDSEVRAVLSPENAVALLSDALRSAAYDDRGVTTPPTSFMPIDQRSRLQVKGAYIGDVGGFRLAGERDHRYIDGGRLMVCYDLATLLPLAVIEEQTLYKMRVGAQLALTVGKLRSEGAKSLTILGAGRLAQTAADMIQSVTPFDEVTFVARTRGAAHSAAESLAATIPGKYRATDSVASACRTADVVVTLTTAQQPIMGSADHRPGMLVVSSGGGWECDEGLYEAADRLIVDDWEQCQRMGDLAVLGLRGVVKENDVAATLRDVVAADVARCGPSERLIAVIQGIAVLDLALARALISLLGQPARTEHPAVQRREHT